MLFKGTCPGTNLISWELVWVLSKPTVSGTLSTYHTRYLFLTMGDFHSTKSPVHGNLSMYHASYPWEFVQAPRTLSMLSFPVTIRLAHVNLSMFNAPYPCRLFQVTRHSVCVYLSEHLPPKKECLFHCDLCRPTLPVHVCSYHIPCPTSVPLRALHLPVFGPATPVHRTYGKYCRQLKKI